MRIWPLALALVLPAAPAHAGRMVYGWLSETEPVPADGVEIGTSIYEHDDLGPYHERSTFVLWTPAVALTRSLELAFPIELATLTADDSAPSSGVSRYGVELRYRLLRRSRELHPLVRAAVSRNVAIQTQVRSELEGALAYERGRVQVEGDVGLVADINVAHVHEELRPGVGASVRAAGNVRFGAELYAQLSRDPTTPSWAAVGPDVAWQRGHFWLAGAFGIGIAHITWAPRLNLGVQF